MLKSIFLGVSCRCVSIFFSLLRLGLLFKYLYFKPLLEHGMIIQTAFCISLIQSFSNYLGLELNGSSQHFFLVEQNRKQIYSDVRRTLFKENSICM